MKSYAEIAQETGTSIEQVRRAMLYAERMVYGPDRYYSQWFVPGLEGYGHKLDRYNHAVGYGETREAAVINALERNPGRFL